MRVKKDEHYKIIGINYADHCILKILKRDHVISFNVALETNLDQEKEQKKISG